MGPTLAALYAIRISVFGLFHPQVLEIKPAPGQVLVLEAPGEKMVLEGGQSARLTRRGDAVEYLALGRSAAALSIRAAARDGRATDLILAVPGKIERRFAGQLEVSVRRAALVAILEMDLETAAASVVAAESPPGAPIEALKAQAVAARSYYRAARRHHGFEFCDTTHCQFLREPPEPTEIALAAALETRGIALAYRGVPLEALYSASCGGRTLSLADAGIESHGYPYFAVDCVACRRSVGRDLGRSLQPVRGGAAGHGLGLCQVGASAMALAGASFLEILSHYYPNTTLFQAD